MYLEDKIREGKNMKEDDIILVINIESYLSTTKLQRSKIIETRSIEVEIKPG